MMPLAAFAVTSCLAVSAGADQILAKDFAAAIPGLTVPAPEVPVAFAPAPGVQRVFRVPELRRMAERFGWNGEPEQDVCAERPVLPPDPARFLAAMRKTMPQAEITILDYGRQPLPSGELEFQANGLRPGGTDALWTGHVRYAGNHRFAIWARVKVLVPVTRVIATVDLAPGRAIATDEVRTETRPEFPPSVRPFVSSEGVIGKWPRAAIRAGTAIRAGLLQNPKEVNRGDTVTVEVASGAAHLELEAVAEAAGAVGETISVLNPESHRYFQARVEGKGRVSVALSAGKVNQ